MNNNEHYKRCNPDNVYTHADFKNDNPDLQPTFPDTTLPNDLIDTLKPLVKACGLTTLKQSSKYYSFYNDVNNRYDFLHECVKKLTSYDRDATQEASDFIFEQNQSLDELIKHFDYINHVRSLLDIHNTIDHSMIDTSLDDVRVEFNKYKADFPKYHCQDIFGIERPQTAPQDEASRQLIKIQNNARRSKTIQRLFNEMKDLHKEGWYFVFDTITLSDDALTDFYNDQHSLRDYCRKFGRLVNESLGRSKMDSYADVYKFFLVPEYGSKKGRLHFHCLHCMKELPINSLDPNYGKIQRKHKVIESMRGFWPYGFTAPIAVRYTNDAYTIKKGWLKPMKFTKLEAGQYKCSGEVEELKPLDAVIFYIAKYVQKQCDDSYKLQTTKDAARWNNKMQALALNKHEFRVRMSRGFGMKCPTMSNLSNDSLMQLTNLSHKVSAISRILKEKARKELSNRLKCLSVENIRELMPEVPNMLKFFRNSMSKTQMCSPLSSTLIVTLKLNVSDISKETYDWLDYHDLLQPKIRRSRHQVSLGVK